MEEYKGGVCRICLDIVELECISLYEKYKDSRISDYINAIANVQIHEDDDLPDRICSSCFVELEQAVQFKHKCERSQNILTSTSTVTEHKAELDEKDIILTVKKEESEAEICYDDPTNDLYEECEDTLNNDPEEEKKSRAVDLHLQCDDCKGFYKSKCKLRVHWKKVHLPDALKCTDCKRNFKSFKAFNSHKKKNPKSCKYVSLSRIEGEGKTRIFYCKECEYKSHRIESFTKHYLIHTEERPLKCDICSRKFIQLTGLKTHQEHCHPEMFEEVPCDICGKRIKGRMRMYKHKKTHSEKKLPCVLCNKKFKTKNDLGTHMIRHKGEKSFTCEICAQSYITFAELIVHQRNKHDKNVIYKMFKCDICEYTNKKKHIIKNHMKRHDDIKTPCTLCGKFFESKLKLQQHHQRIHLGKKLFQCPYCDKEFFRKKSVSKHIKSKHKAVAQHQSLPKNSNKPINKKPKQEIKQKQLLDEVSC